MRDLAFASLMLAVAIGCANRCKNWVNPISLSSACWMVAAGVIPVVGYDFTSYHRPVFYIYSVVFVSHVIGALLLQGGAVGQGPGTTGARQVQINTRIAPFVIIFLACIGVANGIANLRIGGFAAQDIGDYGGYVEAAADIASRKYRRELEIPLLNKVLNCFQNVGSLLGGVTLVMATRRTTWLMIAALSPMVAGLLNAALTTSRLELFVTAFVFGVGMFVGLLLARKSIPRIHARALALGGITTATALSLLLALQMVRQKKVSIGDAWEVVDHLRPWIAGYIPAFSIWMETMYDGDIRFGELTGMGVFRTLGAMPDYGLGSNSTDGLVGMMLLTDQGHMTNAMTVFRAYVNDFGLGGAAFAYLLSTVGASAAYNRAARGSILAALVAGAVTLLLGFGPNYFYFAYGSRVFTFVVGYFVLVALTTLRMSPVQLARRI